MKIETFKIVNNDVLKLFEFIFTVLGCNSAWVITDNPDFDEIKIITTDTAILQHYIDRKYFLTDPGVASFKINTEKLLIKIGTDYDEFKSNGFFYDLYKLFNITEFVSIYTIIDSQSYCFRFFTRNNRFLFLNKLANNISIIKIVIFNIIKKLNNINHLDSLELLDLHKKLIN